MPAVRPPMNPSGTIILKPRRAQPFFGRHPWVFEGAVGRVEGDPSPGAVVRVLSFEKEFIAHGIYNPHSNIRARLFSWDEGQAVDSALVAARIERAVQWRNAGLGLGAPRGACRLVHSESDGLSGLVVDRYADLVVVQFTSLAMFQFRDAVVDTLVRLLVPRGIYQRTERGIGAQEGLAAHDELLRGEVPAEPIVIEEEGRELLVDVRTGQKTGAYLDQRENRRALCRYARGRSVLDVCCYSGGFSLALLQAGASQATGIDVSAAAIELARQNAQRNGLAADFIEAQAVPAMRQLIGEGRRFGLVVCDPPKFARRSAALERALAGYDQINRLALELLEPDGILCTNSCSGHVSREAFQEVLAQASRKTHCPLWLLESRGQAPDHPVALDCPQTGYLTCIIGRRVPRSNEDRPSPSPDDPPR